MNFSVILALVKKDVRGLLPLVLLSWVVFVMQPVIADLQLESASEFWVSLQANFYWMGYLIAILLMISVIQLDPASSLNHDWLTRPIPRLDWLLAKLLFLVVTVCLPVVLARLVVNLGNDYGLARSLAYALAIEKPAALIPVPLVFAVALLTASLRRFLFVSIAVFMLFLIPAWDVSRPLFHALGIDFNTGFDNLMWLQSLPLSLWGVIAAAGVYWLLYRRRQQFKAWLALGCGVTLFFFTIYVPGPVYDWDDAIAIQSAIINRPASASYEEVVNLEHQAACFPAALVAADGTVINEPLLQQAGWVDQYLQTAEAGALTFSTTTKSREVLVEWFEPSNYSRELSVGWRTDRIRVQAQFSAESLPAPVPLIHSTTAVNRYAPMASTDTDYWLVPGELLDTLASDPTTQLTLDFDLALLSPRPEELPTDGQWRDFPALGSCKAEPNGSLNTIEVDCLKRGPLPALVSAELAGVQASRVDSSFSSDLKPDWLESLSRKHYELSIARPDLVDSSVVLLTAYKVERMIHKQVTSAGVLGDETSVCPLPDRVQYAAVERSSWSDRSPHEISSVAVERDVRVEVLDWRRDDRAGAPTLFLLHGLGATVHSYDVLAPLLAEKYNVVGMTRRGVGESGKPDHGYDIARLSQDVLQVLDTLEIERPILVGHSVAGEELSYLGANYPQRFSGLVYLDAAYDRTATPDKRYRELSVSLPEAPPIRPSEATSYAAFLKYSRRLGRNQSIPEGEILASYDLASGMLKHSSLYLDAVMMGLQPPAYANIAIPALGVYAVPGSAATLMEPWYNHDDAAVQATVAELFQMERQQKLDAMARFDREIPDSEVLAIEDANHWIFVSHQQEVLAAIDRFVERLR